MNSDEYNHQIPHECEPYVVIILVSLKRPDVNVCTVNHTLLMPNVLIQLLVVLSHFYKAKKAM